MEKREKFASRLGFILVSAGCAVGLGNVWKFPYICGENGGAAFILIYLICLAALGFPLLICEFAIGRASGKSVGGALKILAPNVKRWHHFRWFGYAGNYLLMMFYTMVAGWLIYYVYAMISGTVQGDTVEETKQVFDQMLMSPGKMILITIAVIVVCIFVCSRGLQNGVESVTKFMMLALLVLMVVMAVHSVTLDGSSEGLKFYLIPDFSKVMKRGVGTVIFDAMTHAFFTLSIGIGSMEIFGSYLKKEKKLTGEAMQVTILDTMTALIAGIIIIPSCFAYGVQPDAGPSLLFVTLPRVFNNMPGGKIWGAMFFLFMSFAALSTVIAVFENIISISMDLFNWNRKKASIINVLALIVLSMPAVFGFNLLSGVQPMGAGSTIMDLEDFIVSYNILPMGSLLFVLFCTRRNGWGFDKFIEEVNTGKGMNFSRALKGYISYVLPVIVLVIYFKGYYDKYLENFSEAERSIPVLIVWMGVAVLFAGVILFLASGKRSKSE